MYQAQDFKHLLGMEGFSEALLTNHFTLYEGYVKNTNALAEKIVGLSSDDGAFTPEYAELKRRFGWEWNGMRLHELYFGNLTKTKADLAENALRKKVTAQFGSVEAWEKDFRATGVMRGIGWAVLAYDALSDTLINTWIGEHDDGHLAGADMILIMDVFEHAFMLDYGIKRAEYVEVFFRSIDWRVVSDRFEAVRVR